MKSKKTERTVIIILSVLLFVSLILLIMLFIPRCTSDTSEETAHVTVTGNVITHESTGPDTAGTADTTVSPEETTAPDTTEEKTESTTADTTAPVTAQIVLYKSHAIDNAPFAVSNMFPGDAQTKQYCVKVSYKGTVTVEFKPKIRAGYDVLAEVLKCKVILQNSGEVLYDGLMSDIPESLKKTLHSDEQTVSELLYSVTVYMDPSVGNRYQNKSLAADFEWWVSEGSLGPPPQTGDNTRVFLYVALMSMSIFVLAILLRRRKSDEKK